MGTTSAQIEPASPSVISQPIAQPRNDGAIAPWPSIDKYGSLVIGPGLSLTYISSIFRISMQGLRQNYVDLLDEMLEKDPHAFAVLSKRVMGVSSGRLVVTAPKLEAGSLDQQLADEIARTTGEMIAAIPAIEERLTELAWALYYGIAGSEIHWVRDGSGWMVDRLSLVHSRRLSYPVSGSWDLYVWDQGQVFTDWASSNKTQRMFGFRVADAPGKFLIHAPQIRGGYPTRNGLGRQIAYWMALKLVASRGGPMYLERFAKPIGEATFTTDAHEDKRVASQDDIAKAEAALVAMGAGTLTNYVHPDTITFDIRTPDVGAAAKLTFGEWIGICDSQISKGVSGGTLGTEVQSTGGNKALGETQRKGEVGLQKHDAGMLSSSVSRDLVSYIVALNYPTAPKRLYPSARIHVEDDPDPSILIDRGAKAANAGMPVDADALAEQAGVPLVKAGDTKARRMFPILAQKDPQTFDMDLAERADAVTKKFPPPEPPPILNIGAPNQKLGPDGKPVAPTEDATTDKGDEPEED